MSVPNDLLRRAALRRSGRSALLALAARRELNQQDPAAVDVALERVRAAMRPVGAFEAADLVRAERDR